MMSFLTLLLVASAAVSDAFPAQAASQLTWDGQRNMSHPPLVALTAEERVKKRGVSYNDPGLVHLFNNDNNKIWWMYNWFSLPGKTDMWYEFIPMLHSDRPDHTGIWLGNVQKCSEANPNGGMHVLSFNEPDQCGNGGSCMQDVPNAVAAHRQWVEPLKKKYGDRLMIVAPAVTNGGGNYNGVGYRMGLDWLWEFQRLCNDCHIDYVAIHWYANADNVEYFKKHITHTHYMTGKRVWITEFFPKGTDDEIIEFLKQVLPWLDDTDFVFRYAMFWASPGMLVNDRGDGLSRIGHFYATHYSWTF